MKRGSSRTGAWLACFFACLYTWTAQRGVAWQDSGIYQLRIVYRDLLGPLGLASAHSFYIRAAHAFAALMGPLFAIEAPVAANLFSALCMAFSVAVLHVLAYELTASRRASLLAALVFGFSHMAWWLATITESYPLSVLLIGLEALTVVRISKYGLKTSNTVAAALFAGIGFGTHNLSLLSLPVTFLVVVGAAYRRNRGIATTFCQALLFGAIWFGSSELIAKYLLSGMSSPGAFAADVLFGQYGREVLGLSRASTKLFFANLALMACSFLSPLWPWGLHAGLRRIRASGGLSAAFRRAPPPLRLVAVLFLVHALFLIRYRIADQALFLLPTLFFASALLAVCLSGIRRPILLAAVTAFCGLAVPLAANAVLHRPPLERRILASRARLLPFRDEVRYWALPWKHDENSAERFASAAIMTLDAMPGAMLYADNTSAPPIMLRLGSASPSWHLYTPWSDVTRFTAAARAGAPAFAVSPIPGYCPAAALATGLVKPLSDILDRFFMSTTPHSPLPHDPHRTALTRRIL